MIRHLRHLVVLATLPAFAAAQQGVPDLVVTATRGAGDLRAVPAATTVLQGDDLRARGIVFVSDALREVPGMALVQTGSYGAVQSLFLRGGESDYVKVLLDGVPLNAPGGSLNLAHLTTDDLDRIEIVRGPASVLYGADAMSGVIQLFTRRGAAGMRGDAEVRGGSFGATDLRGRLSTGHGAVSLSASGSRFGSDGIYDFNNTYRNAVGSARLAIDGGARGRVAVTGRLGDAIARFPTDGAGRPTDRNQRTTDVSRALGVEATRALSSRVTLTAQGFAQRLRAGFADELDSPGDTTGFGFAGTRRGTTRRRGADLRADWRAVPAVLLSVGTGLEREDERQDAITRSNFGTGSFADTTAFEADRTTRHAYTQLLAETGRVSLQAGARLDDNSAFGQFGTWRVGASWRPRAAWRIWGATGTAFKAPTFSELFAASAFEVGNAGLDPERSRNVEIGTELALAAGRASVSVTAFRQRFRDLIQYVSAAPGEPTYTNLGGAEARGLELSGRAAVSGALAVRAHWTLLATEVTDTGAVSSVTFTEGSRLLRRPASTLSATADLAIRRARLSGTVTRVGERDDADFRDFPAARVALPSYVLVDVALDAPVVGFGAGTRGVDLTVRVENLLDAAYEQVVGFPGRGRTVLAGGRVRF
ncbi:MAG TPA: TonB-dependent receptor [Gemmatimonadales bacterium]|nr:TonB-dependent receptor [Gemmatimonadales bacterium]